MDTRQLAQLDYLCGRGVVRPLSVIHEGNTRPTTIGMRHDCDDNGLDSMLAMAEWEASRDRYATYYVLHTAPWWHSSRMAYDVQAVHALGHEVGLHYNAVAEWWRWHKDGKTINPWDVFGYALDQLRAIVPVDSIAGHGDAACYEGKFLNYSMFGIESNGWRPFTDLTGFETRSLDHYGLKFHAELTPRSMYLSDSGGEWTHDLSEVVKDFPFEANTVILQHPDWYPRELFA